MENVKQMSWFVKFLLLAAFAMMMLIVVALVTTSGADVVDE